MPCILWPDYSAKGLKASVHLKQNACIIWRLHRNWGLVWSTHLKRIISLCHSESKTVNAVASFVMTTQGELSEWYFHDADICRSSTHLYDSRCQGYKRRRHSLSCCWRWTGGGSAMQPGGSYDCCGYSEWALTLLPMEALRVFKITWEIHRVRTSVHSVWYNLIPHHLHDYIWFGHVIVTFALGGQVWL